MIAGDREKDKIHMAICSIVLIYLLRSENYELALTLLRYIHDELHNFSHCIRDIAPHVEIIEEETASSLAMRGMVKMFQGAQYVDAYGLYGRAMELGHATAPYTRGVMCLQNGYLDEWKPNHSAALENFEHAYAMGNHNACHWIGSVLENGNLQMTQDRHRAAVWYQRGGYLGDLDRLVNKYPMEVCPFECWTPTRQMQRLVPITIHRAMVTWMMIARRTGVCRGVALMVASYICTRDEVWNVPVTEYVEKL